MDKLLKAKKAVDTILISLEEKRRELTLQINKARLLSDKIQSQIDNIKNYNHLSISQICNFYQRNFVSQQAKAKFIKRNLKGVKPLGIDGIHYRKRIANQGHVDDKCADYVGQNIYIFIQGKTNFLTEDVLKKLGCPKLYKRHNRFN